MRKVKNILFILFVVGLIGFTTACSLQNEKVTIAVDWNATGVEITPLHWGINDYEMKNPSLIADRQLQEFSHQLNPKLVRLHHAGLAEIFLDNDSHQWKKQFIDSCFHEAMIAFPEAEFMLNPIANWPKWLKGKNGVLTKKEEDELVQLYVNFVELAQSIKIPIHSIEVFNEMESTYERSNELNKLWELFNRISTTLKTAYPNIKISGPALTWPKQVWVESFLDQSGKNTDYFTWHGYYSGTPETTNYQVINKGANHIDSLAGYVTEAIARHGLPQLKTCLTEYNVQWVWEPFEIRHANNVGAIFQALIIRNMARRKVEANMIWHLKGFSYGLINNENQIRSTGQLFLWGSRYLTGKMVQSSTTDPEIEAIAVESSEGKQAVLIINKANAQKQFNFGTSVLKGDIKFKARISDKMFEEEILDSRKELETLPPYSLTLISNFKKD
ncbi:MAG: hypothetical protein ACERKD_23365 [Prolixibacteraceae bacterium]